MSINLDNRTLFFGDNLYILKQHIPSDSIDLIYLDPPFNSKASYNVLFEEPEGDKSKAQIEAFDDTWHWTEESEKAFQENNAVCHKAKNCPGNPQRFCFEADE